MAKKDIIRKISDMMKLLKKTLFWKNTVLTIRQKEVKLKASLMLYTRRGLT